MALDEIAKRFTLHDLFGYLLSGSLTITATTVSAVIMDLHKNPMIAEIVLTGSKIDSAILLPMTISLTYFLGLFSVTLGDGVYRLLGWEEQPKFAVSEGLQPFVDRRVEQILGDKPAISLEDVSSLFYADLMSRKHDAFAELMSGRQATFNGLAGVAMLSGLATGTIMWVGGASLVALLLTVSCFGGLVVWALYFANWFDYWWCRHVHFASLALLNNNEHSKEGEDEEQGNKTKDMVPAHRTHSARPDARSPKNSPQNPNR